MTGEEEFNDPFQLLKAEAEPVPAQGAKRFVQLGVKGATLGLLGPKTPARTIPESLTEFAGSVPTIAAVSSVAGPTVGAGLRALKLPLGATGARIAAAGLTGAATGALEGAREGKIGSEAAKSAAIFAATETGILGVGKALASLKAAPATRTVIEDGPGRAAALQSATQRAPDLPPVQAELPLGEVPGKQQSFDFYPAPFVKSKTFTNYRDEYGAPLGPDVLATQGSEEIRKGIKIEQEFQKTLPRGRFEGVESNYRSALEKQQAELIDQHFERGIDPASGLPTLTPKTDLGVQALNKAILERPSQLELPLTNEQMSLLTTEPSVRAKFDIEKERAPLLTGELVKQPEEVVERIIEADPVVPVNRLISISELAQRPTVQEAIQDVKKALGEAPEDARFVRYKPGTPKSPNVESIVEHYAPFAEQPKFEGPPKFEKPPGFKEKNKFIEQQKKLGTDVSGLEGKPPISGSSDVEVLNLGDPTEVGPNVATSRAKTGILGYVRVARKAWGDEFGVKVIDPILRENIKVENFKNKAYREALDIIKPLVIGPIEQFKNRLWGLPQHISERLETLIRQTDTNGRYIGPTGSVTDVEKTTVEGLRKWFNKYGEKFGVDPDLWINYYRQLLKDRPGGILRTPIGSPLDEQFRARLKTGKNEAFYNEFERKGTILQSAPTISDSIRSFINAGTRSTMLKPYLELMDIQANNYFNPRLAKTPVGDIVITNDKVGFQLWKEFKDTLLGGVTPTDVALTNSLQRFGNLFGKQISPRAAYQISQTLSSLSYGGAMGSPLGGRPGTIIRRILHTVPSFSELGAKFTMIGLKDGMKPGQLARYQEKGLISSPWENLLRQMDIASKTGRVVNETTKASLQLFTAIDHYMRVATLAGSEAKFKDYITRGAFEKLGMRRALKDELRPLVAAGKTEEAMDRYMFENIANLQYIYERAARPALMKGAVGNLLNMFMTFPLNTMELWGTFGKRAIEGDPMPLARLMMSTAGLMWMGSEFLNADLWNFTLAQAAMPYSLSMATMGKNAYNVGTSEVEHLVGDLFQTGEPKFHKQQRQEAWKQFERDLSPFTPGGNFFWSDVPHLTDDQALTWFLGFRPKASEYDAILEQRRQEKRATKPLKAYGEQ